jgi:HPt (histidine-containing phosphotransfer) domain-containing protein
MIGDGGGQLDPMAQIWARFQERIRGRIAVLEDAAGAVQAGELPNQLRQHAEQEAHMLAGSLGTFGLAEGSRLAREVEWLLQGARGVEGADALRLSELVLALGQQVATGLPGEQPAPDADQESPPEPGRLGR